MRLHRIYAVIFRVLYNLLHSFNRVVDIFFWPTIDLVLWGLTSSFFVSLSPDVPFILLFVVSGILFWRIVIQAQYELSLNLLEDLWNQNLMNLFVSPLKFGEWVIASLSLGVIKALAGLIFGIFMALVLYSLDLFIYGIYFIPILALLMMTGWWLGFIISGLILRIGTKAESFSWTLVMVIAPFSAIYYPVSVLPNWAQNIAAFVPTSYVFEASRMIIEQGSLNWAILLPSLILNLIYLVLAIGFMRKSFNHVLDTKGLVKLH